MFQDETAAQPSRAGSARGRVGGGCRIQVKVVPGSRKDEVVGALGDRLKIKVSAPAEDGRANAAVCALIAEKLGVSARAVSVVSGFTHPEKVVRVEGMGAEEAEGKLRR